MGRGGSATKRGEGEQQKGRNSVGKHSQVLRKKCPTASNAAEKSRSRRAKRPLNLGTSNLFIFSRVNSVTSVIYDCLPGCSHSAS